MRVQVIDIQHRILRQYIQSFLFFSYSGKDSLSYTTFPNTNLCLSIYSKNNITYIKDNGLNLCNVSSSEKLFKSRLFGFHHQPFNAIVDSSLDQICILLHPGAIRAFTNVPFDELIASDCVFDIIFSNSCRIALEQIFSETSNAIRAQLFESFLLTRLSLGNLNPVVLTALNEMIGNEPDNITISDIARKCRVNPSTLYRLFVSGIGQSPKCFLNTIRFRKALKHILVEQDSSFTNVAYLNSYHDQSHFNKEVKMLSGYTPTHLRKIVSLEQKQLAWIIR